MALIDRLRKARETKVQAGDVTFIVRRPTDLDIHEMRGQVEARRLLPFVVGWEGVTEGHLITGGDPHPLLFDAVVCAEWLADRPDLLGEIVEKLLALYQQHAETIGAAQKN